MKPEHKKVLRYSDQYHCEYCGKTWDVNVPEPPPCKTGRDWFREMREKIKTKVRGDKL